MARKSRCDLFGHRGEIVCRALALTSDVRLDRIDGNEREADVHAPTGEDSANIGIFEKTAQVFACFMQLSYRMVLGDHRRHRWREG